MAHVTSPPKVAAVADEERAIARDVLLEMVRTRGGYTPEGVAEEAWAMARAFVAEGRKPRPLPASIRKLADDDEPNLRLGAG